MTQIQRKIGYHFSRLPDSDHPVLSNHCLTACRQTAGMIRSLPAPWDMAMARSRILDSDRINMAAQERESEFIANRKVLEPLPTAEERRRAHYKEVERIRKEASDYNLGNF